MPNLNVAVIGSIGYSREIGKKGTESDITFYNMKRGDHTVTIMEPSKYPEKLQSLYYTASFADYVILIVDTINASFGETILMLDSLRKNQGIIIPRNYITMEQLSRFIKDTVIEDYTVWEDDLPKLREHLITKAENLPIGASSETGTVIVDHHFNVKGIGAVALGIVKRGQIHKHDKLKALPTTETAQIRSIQRHDTDYDTAEAGNRVGLALKNIEASTLFRGIVLTNEHLEQSSVIKGKLDLVKYWTNPITEGMMVHIGHWMQFNSAKIMEINDEKLITIQLDRPIVHPMNAEIVVTYLNGGNLRVVGTVHIS